MTYHEEAAQQAYDRLDAGDRLLLEQLEIRNCDAVDHACAMLRSWFSQGHPSRPMREKEGQLWALAQLEARRCLGDIAVRVLKIGLTPGPDADIAGNRAKLTAVAAVDEDVLEAVYEPGSQNDNDGYVLLRDGFQAVDNPATGNMVPVFRNKLPLEVGATRASRTWAHLLMDGGVVRWPYGSESLVVLSTTRDWRLDTFDAH